MVDIDSGAIHLKLSAIEAIEGKKAILESEINVLNSLENFKRLKGYRKQESIEKAKAVRLMNEIARNIEETLKLLPREEEDERETNKKYSKKKGMDLSPEEKEKDEISDKLRDIKRKLAELNSEE